MEIILLERIGKLGQMGDTVTVKDGYARNYLLPQGKALRATPDNKERFEKERAQLEARNEELKKAAEAAAKQLEGQTFIAIRQAGDSGQLYGSVSTRDIAELISGAGHQVARHQVQLDKQIKLLGVHDVHVTLHPEVIVTVGINVARSEEEAARQARGEDVTSTLDEPVDEETIAVEEVFEDEDLAKQAEEEIQAAEAELEDTDTDVETGAAAGAGETADGGDGEAGEDEDEAKT